VGRAVGGLDDARVENQRTATRWGVVCGIVRNTLASFIMKVHDLLAVAGPTDAALPVRLG
jgi:hypothetical protein